MQEASTGGKIEAPPVIFLDIDGVLNSSATRNRPTAVGDALARLVCRVFRRGRRSERAAPLWTEPGGIPPRTSHLPAAELVANLKRAVDDTGARIVLSSTWRIQEADFDAASHALAAAGMTICGVTSNLDFTFKGDRVDECLDWLRRNCPVISAAAWVAIDDMDLLAMNAANDEDHFVRTSDKVGLTEQKAQEVIDKIRRQISTMSKT